MARRKKDNTLMYVGLGLVGWYLYNQSRNRTLPAGNTATAGEGQATGNTGFQNTVRDIQTSVDVLGNIIETGIDIFSGGGGTTGNGEGENLGIDRPTAFV